MARVRQQRAAAKPVRRRRAVNVEAMRTAADDFLSRFGTLVDEILALREALARAEEENTELRAELAEGIDLFRDARALVARAEPARRGRGRRAAAAGTARRVRSGAPPRRSSVRATPLEVTGEVVRTVVGRLGTATAGEIAAEISQAGTPVSGRAIRHIARAAGVMMRPGDDGRMTYSLS